MSKIQIDYSNVVITSLSDALAPKRTLLYEVLRRQTKRSGKNPKFIDWDELPDFMECLDEEVEFSSDDESEENQEDIPIDDDRDELNDEIIPEPEEEENQDLAIDTEEFVDIGDTAFTSDFQYLSVNIDDERLSLEQKLKALINAEMQQQIQDEVIIEDLIGKCQYLDEVKIIILLNVQHEVSSAIISQKMKFTRERPQKLFHEYIDNIRSGEYKRQKMLAEKVDEERIKEIIYSQEKEKSAWLYLVLKDKNPIKKPRKSENDLVLADNQTSLFDDDGGDE